jgi:hypothetical protein
MKDKEIRYLLEEVDRLSFSNDLLTKKVRILQDDLLQEEVT